MFNSFTPNKNEEKKNPLLNLFQFSYLFIYFGFGITILLLFFIFSFRIFIIKL